MQDMIAARFTRIRGAGLVAGVEVNEQNALKLSAVYASIRVISETKGSLPIEVFELQAGGKQVRTHSHPVAEALNVEPNLDHTPMVWQETRQAHLLSYGNNFTEITWTNNGDVYAMTPHHPTAVEVFRGDDNRLKYRITESGGRRIIDRDDMLHVPGLGGNGIIGWSPIRMAAESIGIGLATEQFAGAYFANGARPSLIVESEGNMEDAEFASFKEEVQNSYSGVNAHKVLLLEGGMKAKSMSIPLNEAQFLESREYQGEEIACRWYRLPPHVVGYLRRATFSNIEQQDLYFEKHTMRPWFVRDEQELLRKLFTRGERSKFKLKTNVNALLRSDIKTRYEAHKTAILAGFKSRNEIRALEDLNPEEGLDEFPLPEAIFGKSANGDTSAAPQKTTDGERSDPRLNVMLTRTLTGLIHRELTLVERSASKPDQEYRDKVRDFYDRHKTTVREKLGDVVSAEQLAGLERSLESHRDDLITAGPTRCKEICDKWPEETERLAKSLLEPVA